LTTASLPPAKVREAIPVYRSNPPPEYPAVARRRGYEGTVVVEVLVSKEGRVQDLRLFQASGYAVLDRAATAAIKNWLFEPAKVGDEKIEMWVKVPVRFQLK
jgi:protein TonB